MVGAEGCILHFGGFLGGNGRGTDFLCAVGRVLVVVIEVVALGNDEDGRERLFAEHAAGHFTADDGGFHNGFLSH